MGIIAIMQTCFRLKITENNFEKVINMENNNLFFKSMEEVHSILKSNYNNRCNIIKTCLGQDDKRWKRGRKSEFQKYLEAKNLYYFAYIKFYLDNGKKYALVAGKTGSRKVNSSGCDLAFREYPDYEGKAKKWLYDNKKQWCQTEFLVISTEAQEKKQSNKEALEIERYLVKTFGLFES